MKNSIIFLFSFLFTTTNVFSQQRALKPNEEYILIGEKANVVLQECINTKEMVGVSAGLYKDGKIIWTGGAGYMDLKNKIATDKNMLHRIASIAKPMTAIAIMQLYEQKKLDLDDPIQNYLPYFPKKKEGTITIRHLLNHSSGIKAYKNGNEAANTNNYPTLKEAIDVFKNRKLAHKPGTDYKYTTYGYVVLGAIIESTSGMNYRDYMKKNIWEKAGMSNTDIEVFGKKYPNKSKLYRKNKEGKFIVDKNTNLSIKTPGGGLHSTVEDILKFSEATFENKLIKAASLEMMIQDAGLKKQGNGYGFGWYIYGSQNLKSSTIIGHSGAQSGTSAQLFIFLDKKIATIVLANTAGAYPQASRLADNLTGVMLRPQEYKFSIARSMMPIIEKDGITSAVEWYHEMKNSDQYVVLENDMNALGYQLFQNGQVKEAIEIFKLNVEAFPESSNVYDSLGEAYLENGNKKLAILNYEKSVALDANNKNGAAILKKLRKG